MEWDARRGTWRRQASPSLTHLAPIMFGCSFPAAALVRKGYCILFSTHLFGVLHCCFHTAIYASVWMWDSHVFSLLWLNMVKPLNTQLLEIQQLTSQSHGPLSLQADFCGGLDAERSGAGLVNGEGRSTPWVPPGKLLICI